MSKDMRSMASASAARQAATKSGHVVENWISIENWYALIRIIGLRPGTLFQRASERYWYSRR